MIELNYLKSKYGTRYCYTHGGGGYEAKKEGDAYCLYQGDSDKPRNIDGFCFRKDLCNTPPLSRESILLDVHNFSLKKNIESVLDESLRIKFSDVKYLVHTYIGEGLADEINVVFMKIPDYEF